VENYIIGRQPILGRDLQIHAYELLYRNGPLSGIDGTAATQQIITDLLLEQGLSETVGDHKAFINLTRENLLSPILESLPKEQIVLEILEDVSIDEQLIEIVKSLSDQGHTIALDDFVFSPEWEPLIELADIIKLDLRVQTREQNSELIKKLKSRNVELLAEKVESYEEYEFFLNLGCDYFQGFFFCEPSLVKGTKLNSNQSATLRLLSEINDPEVLADDIASIIQQDIGLAHKLLKYINSAFFALPEKIGSIKHASVLLGLKEIKRWATLITISNLSDKPEQLLHLSLQRAKMCELLASRSGERDTSPYFLIGLFSTLDAFLDMQMEEVLDKLNLSEQITEALTTQEGKAGMFLENIIHYQKWELDDVDLDLDKMSGIFHESLKWEKELLSNL
jgi:EAL and modified HD-GYP domain-containing signal transduction protein